MRHAILLVAVAGLVTIAMRFAPFVILRGEKKTPDFISYLGRVLPSAVMAMLVVYCLRNLSFSSLANWLPQLISCAVVVIVHIIKRSTLLSILSGTLCYMILVQRIF